MTDNEPSRGHRRTQGILAGAGFAVAFVLALFWPAGRQPTQPIRYNHEKHISAGLECTNCHTLAENSPWAGLPQLEFCLNCHQEPVGESPEEAKLREFAEQSRPLQWKQVNQLPTHVYFSHKTHVASREIACATCHGSMEKATSPPSKPLFAWTIDACLDCHERQKATEDCNGCHR